jgi:long-chain acyl-CoA synthetase
MHATMKANSDFDQTLVELIAEACARFSDRPAFSCLGVTLSYRDLERLSGQFAAYLQHHAGLRPGDRLAVQLPNLLHFPVVVHGALRAGIVVVNTNPLYTAAEMEHQMRDSGARLLVTMASGEDKAVDVAGCSDIETLVLVDPLDFHGGTQFDLASVPAKSQRSVAADGRSVALLDFKAALAMGGAAEPIPVAITPQQLALLQYTGGTTGLSKGAMLSHRNLVANTLQVAAHSSAFFREGEECYIAALPLYHIYAFTIHAVLLPYKGGHSVLIPNPRDFPALVNAIAAHRFTGFPGINTLFAALCRDEQFRQLDFSALRSASAGGMALSADVAKAWRELTGIEIAEGYGMSETSPVVTANPPGRIQVGTVGLPIPFTEVKTIDADGEPTPVGEPGELCVRGPQVMQGYWQRPDETAQVLSEDGWLRTGDIAVIQPDGYIRIVDRLKEMIVVSGFNVYPSEVESVARMHPSVRECAAVGVADGRSGEAVKLFVVPEVAESFDAELLRRFMRTRLTPYKIPTQVEVVAELPKSNVGKVLRRLLKPQASAAAASPQASR